MRPLALLFQVGARLPAVAGERPDVVLILADGQGQGDINAPGDPVVRTPALDRLHGASVRLTGTCSTARRREARARQ